MVRPAGGPENSGTVRHKPSVKHEAKQELKEEDLRAAVNSVIAAV